MTDERIKAVFEEYGQLVTGKEYALIQAIAEAVTPQRTWVGLTEDEVALIAADCSLVTPSDFYFYQAIEAKLMEKNA